MATAGGLITLRPREFHLFGELWHELIHLTLGVSAWIANWGFFTFWENGYVAGDTMYVINNVIEIFMNIHSITESRQYIRENEGKLAPYQIGNTRREVRENYIFTFGSLCFAVGAILFEELVYESCSHEDKCLLGAGYFFTIGSALFLLGSFMNTMGVSITGAIEQQDLNTVLATTALGLNVGGSAFYLAGSPFYMPTVGKEDTYIPGSEWCPGCNAAITCPGTDWPAANTGTSLYVIGGTFFLAAKIFRVWLTIRKHEDEVNERNRVGPKKSIVHVEPRHNVEHRAMRVGAASMPAAPTPTEATQLVSGSAK